MPDQANLPAPDSHPIRSLVEDLPVPSALLEGPGHCIVYCNPAFIKATGRDAAGLIGRPVAEAFPRQAVGGRVALLDLVLASGQPVLRHAQPLRLEPGELRFWNVEATPWRHAGSTVGILLQCREVTAQQQALRQGEAARATLDALFDHVPEGLAIVEGRTARMRRVSAHGLAMIGRAEAEVIGHDAESRPAEWHLYHPDGITLARPAELPLARAAGRGELVQNSAWLIRDAGGRLIPILSNAGPIRDAGGRVTGAILAWRDVSEARRAEAALRASEARFRSLAEAMPHGVWQTDPAGRMEYFNARWRDYGGAAAVDGWTAMLHPDDAPRFEEDWATVRAAGAELDVDVRLKRALDGAWRWFRVKGAPVADAAGVLHHWVGTCTDIEERRQAANALRVALAAQETLAREADHRIKNSLQLVAALLRLQSGRAAQPEIRAALDAATARVRAVAEAHRALQNSADLRSIRLYDMLRDLAAAAGALHPGADIRIVASEELSLDAERAIPLALVLSELLTNVLTHAYPHGRSGPVYLLAEAVAGRLLATVADDGVGLASNSDGGRSLGGMVIHSLARQIGATVTQAANGARGLRVTLDLPLDPAAMPSGATPEDQPEDQEAPSPD